MRNTPLEPGHGNTPPKPSRADAVFEKIANSIYNTPPMPSSPTNWTGSRPGAVAIATERDDISASPQETSNRRQGDKDQPGNRRAGPVREQGEGWIYAPSTSHISRFMFVPAPDKTQASKLQVVFKGSGGGGESAEYVYYFSNVQQGIAIYDDLRRNSHPYGSVLYPKVIQTGVPYHPLSRS